MLLVLERRVAAPAEHGDDGQLPRHRVRRVGARAASRSWARPSPITATQHDTTVTVKTSADGAGPRGRRHPRARTARARSTSRSTRATSPSSSATGDQNDLSGSLVAAGRQPIQVITGLPCINQPEGTAACDHIEESVFPAETLGKHYVVTVPTGPDGQPVGHIVRFFGNVDGTTLTYNPSKPAECPATLNAGQVVDCGQVDGRLRGEGRPRVRRRLGHARRHARRSRSAATAIRRRASPSRSSSTARSTSSSRRTTTTSATSTSSGRRASP